MKQTYPERKEVSDEEVARLSGWRGIEKAPNQSPVLVCNDCLLGWHAVAIQNALGEWLHYGTPYTQTPLRHEPTHFQELPSIEPISIRRPKAMVL